MFDIYRSSHEQTAHGGRDKCLEFIATNYSWLNRSLLQIFISQCTACQLRKSIKISMVSKPMIVLGNFTKLFFMHLSLIFFCLDD
jgi:hypothetical protein